MKACAFVFLFVFCYAECRKTYAPIDKNANLAFINMEGGGVRPAGPPAQVPPVQPVAPAPTKPASPPASPIKPAPPSPTPAQKPVPVPVAPSPTPTPVKLTTPPYQIQPKPVNSSPVVKPITTPGPGSVKQLVNFYDSQGKASPIRPYSYSQAVKQG